MHMIDRSFVIIVPADYLSPAGGRPSTSINSAAGEVILSYFVTWLILDF